MLFRSYFQLNLIENRSDLMAKTIRSHPTSPFILPEPIFCTTLIFSKYGPEMDLHFLHFPTSLQVKRPRPKGKKMRMDHPIILVFCQNVTCDTVFTIIFQFFGKAYFLKLLSCFNHFVYLRFKNGRPQIVNTSTSNSYFKLIILSQRYIRSPINSPIQPYEHEICVFLLIS